MSIMNQLRLGMLRERATAEQDRPLESYQINMLTDGREGYVPSEETENDLVVLAIRNLMRIGEDDRFYTTEKGEKAIEKSQ